MMSCRRIHFWFKGKEVGCLTLVLWSKHRIPARLLGRSDMEGCWVVERRAGSNKGDFPLGLFPALLYLAYVQPVGAPGKGIEWEDLGDKAHVISAKQKPHYQLLFSLLVIKSG